MIIIMCGMSITGKHIFCKSDSLPDVNIFDILISWNLANAGDAVPDLKLSLFEFHCYLNTRL